MPAPLTLARIHSKYIPDPATGCWIWQASLTPGGYGCVGVNSRRVPAHRFFYELYKSKIPDGLQIDHLCRNRACVNPDHLEPVTQRENLLRGIGVSAQSIAKTHCPKGHLYTPENTYHRPSKPHWRACRICNREKTIQRRTGKQTHCKQGHELAGANISIRRRQRVCLICNRVFQKKYKDRIRTQRSTMA